MELLLGLFASGFIGTFWYAHFHFWKTLKAEAPEVYQTNSDFSFVKYTKGMQWVDYALRREYKRLNNERISRAGDSLCKAYDFYQSMTGIALLVISLGVLVWAISVLVQAVA